MASLDSLDCLRSFELAGQRFHYYSLSAAAGSLGPLERLPKSLKVLLENLLRFEDNNSVCAFDAKAIADWLIDHGSDREIQFRPARVLMQDFTGVPAVVDLAAMRQAVAAAGGDPQRINPLSPVELVIDHSVMVDHYASGGAFARNVELEMQRNGERYAFLRWGQQAFDNFRVVPPGTGICHQVNLEYLARVVCSREQDGMQLVFPDSLVGTDSHTTMINGLGVLGWGVGGIEAEAAMLGQPLSMLIPEVIGVRLHGRMAAGITATDLVLRITQMLRSHGVVGCFVEFYGDGLAELSLADRATLANMAPEYGATCGFFPIDQISLDYLQLSGRKPAQIQLVEHYCKLQGLWRNPGDEPAFSRTLELDLGTVRASLAGPRRPQDRVPLGEVASGFDALEHSPPSLTRREDNRLLNEGGGGLAVGGLAGAAIEYQHAGRNHPLPRHAVVIAAITSCTNTSNPAVMLTAGLLAQKAVARGLRSKPWVKTSLAPGSQVVSDYLRAAGLMPALEALGFNLVGYGCTTCIGNSGPLLAAIEAAISDHRLTVAAVLSGNRNFEGRIHPLVKSNWLASPPLVVAYALAGDMSLNLEQDPLGSDSQGLPVYLRELWPSPAEVSVALALLSRDMFVQRYAAVFDGDERWQAIEVAPTDTYAWQPDSSYIRHPPFFDGIDQPPAVPGNIEGARILALLGDSVTTDHISPAGNIKADSPAGQYLQALGIKAQDFNSYGSRRGNHEVMMRGTFANIRLRNELMDGEEGGYTRLQPGGERLSIYDAAMHYQAAGTALLVIAGKEYGTGSSRDWAAKGTRLLGVRAVIAESFERIHRSNLVGMGVLPLQFSAGQNRQTLGLRGDERLSVRGLDGVSLQAGMPLELHIERSDGRHASAPLLCRIDTQNEVEYFKAGGILHYVLRQLLQG